MASSASFPSLVFQAVAGPTWRGPNNSEGLSEMRPFKWSETELEDKPEWRPIDEFNFQAVNHTWVVNVNGANAAR